MWMRQSWGKTEEVIGVFKRELDDLEDRRNDNGVKLSSIKHKVFELEEQQYMTRWDFWRWQRRALDSPLISHATSNPLPDHCHTKDRHIPRGLSGQGLSIDIKTLRAEATEASTGSGGANLVTLPPEKVRVERVQSKSAVLLVQGQNRCGGQTWSSFSQLGFSTWQRPALSPVATPTHQKKMFFSFLPPNDGDDRSPLPLSVSLL